jgi:hypothetical protein
VVTSEPHNMGIIIATGAIMNIIYGSYFLDCGVPALSVFNRRSLVYFTKDDFLDSYYRFASTD